MKFDPALLEEHREVTYAIYQTLHAARTVYSAKTTRTIITELMYSQPEAWRAVGITRAALSAYIGANHQPIKGIERAHIKNRAEMCNHIFNRDEPLTRDELFSYWIKHDRVVIALRSENRMNQLGDWIPFDNPDGQLFTRLGIGFRYHPATEGAFTRSLIERLT